MPKKKKKKVRKSKKINLKKLKVKVRKIRKKVCELFKMSAAFVLSKRLDLAVLFLIYRVEALHSKMDYLIVGLKNTMMTFYIMLAATISKVEQIWTAFYIVFKDSLS